MKNHPPPALGPATMGTLVTKLGRETVATYTDHLQQRIFSEGKLSKQLIEFWGAPKLEGANYWILENLSGKPWLRIIEDPNCQEIKPLRHTGWMSLEVSVQDVDSLSEKLANSPFKIIGPPANLDVSDKIRAMQVVGLAGEVLYLTEIKGDVPPFELPAARCPVDSLFIPVLCCHNRAQCLKLYESISGNDGLTFDTKITVVNRSYGYQFNDKHPVATLQLADNTLIEIDQINEAEPRQNPTGKLDAGISIVSFEVENLEKLQQDFGPSFKMPAEPPYYNRRSIFFRGQAGECIELIEK